jgi:hypothetical protein
MRQDRRERRRTRTKMATDTGKPNMALQANLAGRYENPYANK